MRDILRFDNPSTNFPFGGKTVVLGGDFRQILPVIPKGTMQDIVGSSINSSYLWSHCKVLRLTQNLRLQSVGSTVERINLAAFANWIAAIGDGQVGGPNDGHAKVEIPQEHVLKTNSDPIRAIVENTFPRFSEHQHDGNYLIGRAILALTLEVVDEVNEYMRNMNAAESQTYFSSDSVCPVEITPDSVAALHTPEFLNRLKYYSVPNHSLTLKVGSPIMLLRNIDHSDGLCNGTRLIISKLGDHVVEAKILFGSNAGTKVLIPRLSLTPSDPKLPFKFQRRQFPLMLSYAMTINKSQGQTFSTVGLLLKKPIFVHGQLYVALSRISNPNGLKLLIYNDNGEYVSSTSNVVYKEVFNNI
ncbi:PREDICTED: ATP-dependent DNA helicase PIF1-like [Ipomoea nil]|uniref:ATP-dependent DNA helicase PIF1-like n=1 Tax=Ipomoea nil TaxID=35883 RepID=UPI000901E1AA|nr:PREDICTED: ATP-dependent DNA helicase PIF1-like [Ipomoea nil]